MRTLCLLLMIGLSWAVAAPAEEISAEERALLRTEIRAYLLENPEVLREAMAILEEREAAEAARADTQRVQDNATQLFDDGYSFVGGNPEGKITIVEFIDYQCGFCKRAHPEIQAIIESDPDVRYVVKELPLLGPASTVAARVAMAILEYHGPEVYGRFNDALLTHRSRLTEQVIANLAAEVGADLTVITTLAEDRLITERLNANRTLANAINLTGTPTFVIGETMVRGFVPEADIRAILEQEKAAL